MGWQDAPLLAENTGNSDVPAWQSAPVYEEPQQVEQRDVRLGEAAKRIGTIASAEAVRGLGILAAPAIMAIDSIAGQNDALTDGFFKTLDDIVAANQEVNALQQDERLTAGGMVGAVIGGMAPQLALTLATGGAGIGVQAATLPGRIAAGVVSVAPGSAIYGTQRAGQVIERGGSMEEAAQAGLTSAGTMAAGGAIPIGVAGQTLQRMGVQNIAARAGIGAASGAAIGIPTEIAATAIENMTLPDREEFSDLRQDPFSAETLIGGGLMGSVFGGVHGAVGTPQGAVRGRAVTPEVRTDVRTEPTFREVPDATEIAAAEEVPLGDQPQVGAEVRGRDTEGQEVAQEGQRPIEAPEARQEEAVNETVNVPEEAPPVMEAETVTPKGVSDETRIQQEQVTRQEADDEGRGTVERGQVARQEDGLEGRVEEGLAIRPGAVEADAEGVPARALERAARRTEEAAIKLGEVVDEFAGQYGKGMTEFNAKRVMRERAKKNPELDYTIEETPQFGADRFKVVGRTKPLEVPAERPAVERRTDLATRKRIADMTPDEMRHALQTDDLTGLKNRRAYNDGERLPVQIHVDMDSLKWVNDTLGHDAGDTALKKIGEAIRSVTDQGYRMGGDEFVIQAKTRPEAAKIVAAIKQKLDAESLEANGQKMTGIPFSAGWGKTSDAAEAMLQRTKQERQASGERAARGEKPKNVIEYKDMATAGSTPSERVSVRQKLTKLKKLLDSGKINEGRFIFEVDQLINRITDIHEKNIEKKYSKGRVRGVDWIRERLLRAKRNGEISEGHYEFAEWLLTNNPNIANDLGVSMKLSAGESETAGMYNPASRIFTLFTDYISDTTAVHEILHHSERMMPEPVQKAIIKEWGEALSKAVAKADTPERKAALLNLVSASVSDVAKIQAIKDFKNGILDAKTDYQYANPSEYWAVNATRIMRRRYESDSWIAKAKQWLREFIEKAKGAFGLSSDAPIIKGLQAVLDGDGSFQTKKMLAEKAATFSDIAKPEAPLTEKTAEQRLRELNRSIREQDVTLWNKASKFLKRNLTPGGLLPKSAFNEKLERDFGIGEADFMVRHMVGVLENEVRKAYGSKVKNLDAETQRLLSDAMAGRIDPAIPEKVKIALLAMRQYIDNLSMRYLRAMTSQIMDIAAEGGESADVKIELMRTIMNNLGTYVHRSYKAFDDPNWYKKVPDDVLNDARAYLKNQFIENGLPDRSEVVLNEILKHGTAYESIEAFIKESKVGAKDLSILMRRKDIAPEIRALLGEYTDPRINFAKTVMKMGRLIYNQAFLDNVRKVGMGEFLFTDDNKPPRATVKIAADNSEVYSPLNGLWTTPEIAQAFKDALGKDKIEGLYRAVVQLNGMIKLGKTVLAPTTALRNWMSAAFFTLFNGHFNWMHIGKSVSGLREYFSHRGSKAKVDYLAKLIKLGVIYDNPNAGDMIALLADADLSNKLRNSKGLEQLSAGLDYAIKFYQYGDDFWKIMGFENEKRNWLNSGFDEEVAEKKAAERIRNTYPTYSMVGRGIRWLRRFPLIGTFVSFPAEIIRTSYNAVRYLAADSASNNPGVRKMAKKRAAGMVVTASLAYAAQEASKALLGFDDDDEDAVRNMAAPWQKNSNLIFTGRDQDGNLRYMDISFLDPYNYWKRPINAIMRDEPWFDTVKDIFKETLTPFLGTDIGAGVLLEILSNQKQSFGKIFDPNDTLLENTIDIARHIQKTVQPGILSNLERTFLAMTGEKNRFGEPMYNIRDEMAAWAGFRMSTLQPKKAVYYSSFDFGDTKDSAEKKIKEVILDTNDVSLAQLQTAYDRSMKIRNRGFQKMIDTVNAARRNGLDDEDIDAAMERARISKADREAIMEGEIPPWQPSKETVRRTIRDAENNFGEEGADRVRERYDELEAYADESQ